VFCVPIVTKGAKDNNDSIIRKFSKKVIAEGILTEVRKRDRYKKPSVKKKEKLSEFKRLRKRAQKRTRVKWTK